MSSHSIPLKITNSRDILLDARIELPESPRYFAIMCHCFTCTKDTITTHRLSRGLAQRNIAVLRFDFTGLGKSDGEFADTNFDTMLDDLLVAAQYLKAHYQAPQVLMGHSMGGTVALAAASQIDSCKAVVTLASPSEPRHVLHHFEDVINELEAGHDAHIQVAGVHYPVKPQFVDNVRAFSMQQCLAAFNKPVLAIRAGQDELVASHNADDIVKMSAAHPHTQLLEIAQANHLFTDKQDSEQLLNAIEEWLNALDID